MRKKARLETFHVSVLKNTYKKSTDPSLDFSKVLVIGGLQDGLGYLNNVEVVDLSSETPSCDSVANYPYPVGFPVGTLLDGMPTVCGGFNSDTGLYTNKCTQYIYEENRWVVMEETMSVPRYVHRASMVDSATWLITGGDNIVVAAYDSTDVWQNDQFQQGPFLPYPLRRHCQVTVNSTHVAILGGYNGTVDMTYFYLLDWRTEEWIAMPDVPVTLANDPCGVIENSINGVELVVLHDWDQCHIFNFGDMTWRAGPNVSLDFKLTYESMPVQMEETFYILGGYLADKEAVTDAIFKFDNENYAWNLQTARLQTARRRGVAIAVPDEMVNCV